jgi:hypothetical protein
MMAASNLLQRDDCENMTTESGTSLFGFQHILRDDHDRSNATMEPALTKKLLLQKQPKQRISNEAIVTANELLRLFVVEARQRASIEVSIFSL